MKNEVVYNFAACVVTKIAKTILYIIYTDAKYSTYMQHIHACRKLVESDYPFPTPVSILPSINILKNPTVKMFKTDSESAINLAI